MSKFSQCLHIIQALLRKTISRAVHLQEWIRGIESAAELEKMKSLAAENDLKMLGRALPAPINLRARLHCGKRRRVRLSSIMAGNDSSGFYHIGRRWIGGRKQLILFFDSKTGTSIEGFQVEITGGAGDVQHWLEKVFEMFGFTRTGPLQLRTSWMASPEHLLSERAISIALRTIRQLADLADDPHALALGVTIQNERVLIHATEHYGEDDLALFIPVAQRLREDLLPILNDSRTVCLAPSRGITRAVSPVRPTRERGGASTQTAGPSQEHAVEEVLSAIELLKEREPEPVVSPSKAPRPMPTIFEIPEPGENVKIISGQLAH